MAAASPPATGQKTNTTRRRPPAPRPTRPTRTTRTARPTTDRPRGASAQKLLAAIDVVSSFVSSFEPARYDGRDAARLVEAFTRGKRLCSAGETLAAARAAECNAHLATGHRDPADWLASVTGASRGEATDVLRVANALPCQPGGKMPCVRGSSPPRGQNWCPTRSRSIPSGRTNWSRGPGPTLSDS